MELQPSQLCIVNAYDIFMKDLPPTKWYVGDILQEGACLLSGDPKVGKSFLALQIALAVAGQSDSVCGSLRVGEHGRVLYLALDDGSEKRIHDRLHLLGADEESVRNLDFVYQRDLPSLSNGLDELLDKALSDTNYVLVVLDTLGAVLNVSQSTKSLYRADYREAIRLQKFAQKHGICLLILHHTNKGEGRNPVARASGSHGLTGAVDSVLLLSSDPLWSFTQLKAIPRDGEASDHNLVRAENGGWTVSERAVEQGFGFGFGWERGNLSPEQLGVKAILEQGAKSRDELAADLGISLEATRKRLERMAAGGLVVKSPEGIYSWVAPS